MISPLDGRPQRDKSGLDWNARPVDDKESGFESKIQLKDLISLGPEQIYNKLILEANSGDDYNLKGLIEALLEVLSENDRTDDYDELDRRKNELIEITQKPGFPRRRELVANVKELAKYLQDLIADLQAKGQIDL